MGTVTFPCSGWYSLFPWKLTDQSMEYTTHLYLVLTLKHVWCSISITSYTYMAQWLSTKSMFIFYLVLYRMWTRVDINLLTPNDDYSGRTAPLTSKCCILYIYSTNISTEYFEHGIYSPFFPLQNAVCFINLTYLVPVLFTFYIQGVLKLKK